MLRTTSPCLITNFLLLPLQSLVSGIAIFRRRPRQPPLLVISTSNQHLSEMMEIEAGRRVFKTRELVACVLQAFGDECDHALMPTLFIISPPQLLSCFARMMEMRTQSPCSDMPFVTRHVIFLPVHLKWRAVDKVQLLVDVIFEVPALPVVHQ